MSDLVTPSLAEYTRCNTEHKMSQAVNMTPEQVWKSLDDHIAIEVPAAPTKAPSKWIGDCEDVAKKLDFDLPEPSAPPAPICVAQTVRLADIGGYVLALHLRSGRIVYIDSMRLLVLFEKMHVILNGTHDIERAVIYDDNCYVWSDIVF